MAAATKASYDPVRVLDGMFNGSVTRIGYALSDPAQYGENTKLVLAECAKRFQDALDDCEIQLLEAKWYLESKLAENRAKREESAKQQEAAAAAAAANTKRKHEELDVPANVPETDASMKKIKSEQDLTQPQIKSSPIAATTSPEQKPDTQSPAQTSPQTKQEPEPATQLSKPAESQKLPDSQKPPDLTQASTQPTELDDFIKPTPLATPAHTADDFNFTSMFNDDPDGGTGDNDNDINMGLDFENTFNDFTNADADVSNNNLSSNTATQQASMDMASQDPSSLSTLLPGLEAFANQNMDDPLNPQPQAPTTLQDANPFTSTEFDLPDISGPNIFDEFLGDDSIGLGGDGVDNAMGGDMNIDLNDTNINFDDLFGDGS